MNSPEKAASPEDKINKILEIIFQMKKDQATQLDLIVKSLSDHQKLGLRVKRIEDRLDRIEEALRKH